MFLNWFDTKEIELFAVSLGDEFRQRIALSIAGQPERERSRALDAAMHVILARVDKFISNGSANFYKKACFGNKLKWHLKDFGYPDAVVDQVVLAAVKRLSGLQTRRL